MIAPAMACRAVRFRVLVFHVLALSCALLAAACQDEADRTARDKTAASSTADKKTATDKAATDKAAPSQAAPSQAATAPILNIDLFCPEICKRTRQLGCRAADRCDLVCRSAFSQMPCPEQLQPAMECALSQPLSAWICSPDGFGAVKDGPCDREQTAYDTCLNATQ